MRIVSPLLVIAAAMTGAQLVVAGIGTTAPRVHRDGAQDAVIDAGSFTISRGGTTVGREAFSIRRVNGGTVATATVVYADQRLVPVLTLDSAGVPVRYQLEVRSAAGREILLTGRAAAGYFSIKSETRRGEAARELPLRPAARLVDDGIFHQWYFVAQDAVSRESAVPLIRPREAAQATVQVTPPVADTIRIDTRLVSALRTSATGPDGIVRDIWADTDGHLLAVSQDSAGTTTMARRDELPR